MLRKKVLGVGTSSATLLVEDTATQELKVLKRINVAGWSEVDITTAQETLTALSLSPSPLLVEVQNVLLQNSFLNVVCPYFPDGTLQDYLHKKNQVVTVSDVVHWASVLLLAVHSLHQASVLHAGIQLDRVYMKPNLSRDAFGIVVGLPQPLAVYEQWLATRLPQVSGPEAPPELLENNNNNNNTGTTGKSSHSSYDTRCDVWALGRALQLMLDAINVAVPAKDAAMHERLRRVAASMSQDDPTMRPQLSDVLRMVKGGGGSEADPSAASSIHDGISPSSGMRSQPLPHHQDPHSTPRSAPVDGHNNNNNNNSYNSHSSSPPPKETNSIPGPSPTAEPSSMTQTWRERAGAQFAELEMMQSAMQQQRRGADRGGGGGRREQSPLPRVPFEGAVPLEEQSRQVDGWAAQQQQRRTPQRRTAASTGNRPTRAAQIVQSVTGYSAMTVQAVRDEQEELRRRKEILARDVAARRTKQQEQQKQTNEALRNHAETIRKIRTNSAATSHRDDIRRSIRQWKTNQEEERRQAHVANIHINAVAGIEDNNGDSDSAVLGEGEVGAAAAAASPLRVVPSSPGVSIFVKGRQDHGLGDVLRVPQQQQQYRMAAANRQGEPDRPQQHNHRTAQEDDDNEEDISNEGEGEEEGEVDDEATAVAAEEDDNTVRLTRPSTHADPSRVFLDDTTPQPERHPPSRLATAAPVSLDADGVPPSSSATLSSSAVALVGPHNSQQRKLWYEDDEDSLSPPRNRPPTAVANAHPPPPPLAVDVHRPRNEPLRAAPAQQEQQQQAAPSPLMSFEQDDAPHPRKQLSGHHQYSSTAATAHRGLSQQHSPSSSSPVAAAADWAVDAIRTAMRSTLTAQEVEEIFIVIATLVRRPAAERLFPDTNAQFTAQVRRILLRVALRQQQPLDRVDASIDAVMPLVWQLVGIQGIQQMALEMQRRDGI